MKIDDLPTDKNPESKRTEACCPKCGAFSDGDWSQCKGFCPISVSPHYSPSTEAEYRG